MKTTISAKKMQIPQNFSEYAETRINSRLGKFFGDDADAKIVLAEVKTQIELELTVKYNSNKPIAKHLFISRFLSSLYKVARRKGRSCWR